jgi:hypothetical protein
VKESNDFKEFKVSMDAKESKEARDSIVSWRWGWEWTLRWDSLDRMDFLH